MKTLAAFVFLLIVGFGSYLYSIVPKGFTDADIVEMRKSIKAEFEKNSQITVTDVVMLRESDYKATGYAKLSVGDLKDITKSCTAQMDQASKQYFWRCN